MQCMPIHAMHAQIVVLGQPFLRDLSFLNHSGFIEIKKNADRNLGSVDRILSEMKVTLTL